MEVQQPKDHDYKIVVQDKNLFIFLAENYIIIMVLSFFPLL